jgi:hypothetical protein
MTPTSFFVGLAIDPDVFTFESGKLVHLPGHREPRVPSEQENGDDFDAPVDHRYVASVYR